MSEHDPKIEETSQSIATVEKNSEDAITPHWKSRLGRDMMMLSLGLLAGSIVFATLFSIYQSISAPPPVWGIPSSTQHSAQRVTKSHIKVCFEHLKQLNNEQSKEATALWFRMRYGHRGHLTLWQEWSRDWRKRVKKLLKQCHMRSNSKEKIASSLRSKTIKKCVQNFSKLNEDLKKRTEKWWLAKRRGHHHYLKGWKDWSNSWQQRVHTLLKTCPIYGQGEIARAFRRAHSKMLALQDKQEKALIKFFTESSDLFRDIRQSLHSLREELR